MKTLVLGSTIDYMKVWIKTIVSLTLICYTAASSIASAHAFPFPSKFMTSEASHADLTAAVVGVSPDCHRQVSSKAESNTVSVCKMFCNVMSNIILDEKAVFYLPPMVAESEVAFLLKNAAKFTLVLDPYPPK